MPRGPVEAKRGAPVVNDQRDVALEIEALEERVEMARVILEAIRAGRRGPDAPMPMRSGATHRPCGARYGIMLRHKYDEVGLP